MTIQSYSNEINGTQNALKVLSCGRNQYSTPRELYSTFALYIDENGCKTYMHVDNDDRINIHDHAIPSIYHGHVEFQPILSLHAVKKYIAKYALKA